MVDGIEGDFKETYLVGQYVLIKGTILADGVYKITTVASGKLTLDAAFTPETEFDVEHPAVVGLAVPKAVIDLAAEIESFNESAGVASESLGDYSISYGEGGSWEKAYKSKMAKWKRPYSDLDAWFSRYRWQDKSQRW